MRYANFDDTKLLVFSNFLKNVKAGEVKPLQRAILTQCDVSFTAYRKWIRGLTIPRPKNQKIINDVAENFGYGMVYLFNNECGD